MDSREDETYFALTNEYGDARNDRALFEIAISIGMIVDILAEMKRYIVGNDDRERVREESE